MVGQFGAAWHPLAARIELAGSGIGQLRTIGTVDGRKLVERLDAIDDARRVYRYTSLAGIPAAHCTGVLEVKSAGSGCACAWRMEYLADKLPDIVVKDRVSTLMKAGLNSLQQRFGAAP